ncbi:serine-rich adhesin for platelets-like isoform X2 [Leptidea sinapis]|uniref:serine-rich adhesin for platelets-like isoform X2 n=1 Tax=Leptidea sinapis TaxID=189913 RepID=UPI0021C34526|nr:serine-rich adhesin for platelets-like isoform X2 [Leptidea sinapis]
MDPVGPWSAYASYNRLAGVQAGAASGDFHHHLASSGTGLGSQSVPSTTSQLLLQAAHTTASLAGQLGSSTASPFNPGGFLSPPAVSYDAVFSPLFHHGNPKPAHYSSTLQHRQVIAQAQAQAQAAAASKQSSVETELSSLRENYSHQTLAAQGTFFDQPSTGSTAGLSWQGNNQLPSPFGILPHESVVPSSPSPATTKSAASYENFNAHFAATQNLNNHINSQIANTTKPTNRSGSPATASKQPVSSAPSTFFQSPSTFGNQTENSYSSNSSKSGQLSAQQDYAGSKSYSSSASSAALSQQSCIVSNPPVTSVSTPSKDFRTSSSTSTTRSSTSIYNSQSPKSASSEKSHPANSSNSGFASPTPKPPQVQTKAQSKVYPEIANDQRKSCDSNDKLQPQSSPISYSIMDAPGRLSFSASNGSSSKSRIGSLAYSSNQSSSFRHYQSGNNVESDYHVRAKSSSSTDTGYSSSSSQNGPDCSLVGSKRQSPLQSAPQTSPLGHGSSPAYPVYHSPMNSMNSPQPHGEHYSKVPAPRSPLDASISRPPSQNSQVAYPSVITRALGIEQNKTYAETRYERNQPPSSASCWDAERQKKFSISNNNNVSHTSYNTSSDNNTHEEKPPQNSNDRTLGLSEKHQHYFDSNNVALQDLSSCRGDPMTIVKNLQNLQQNCQLQDSKASKTQTPITNTIASKVVRRKSTDKPIPHSNELSNAAVMADYLASRIPPPAHSSTSNQQQNGTYFDFERWNLPPPPPKMFPGTTPFGSQAQLHASNFANQHQALAMQHGHALTYFPPFHLGPHPDFPSSVELTPLSSFSDTPPSASSSSFSTPETREEEQPKVVVPNIEEELGFLAERANSASTVAPTSQQQNLNNSQDTSKVMDKKFNVPVTGPGSGFMASYLKFLQGERDTSPPPAGRGARKSTWSRTNTTSTVNNNKTYNTVDHTKSPCDANSSQQNANGAMAPSNPLNTVMPLSNPVLSSPVSMNTTGLLGSNQIHGSQSNLLGSQGKGVELDDPRYYNLNKERKRKFDGSDESSYDAEEEARRLNKPVLNVPSTPLNDKTKKSRSTAMNKPTPSAVVAPQPAAPKKPRPPAPPPVAPLQAAPQQQYYYQHQPEEGYGTYGSTDNDNSSRKLHNIKSHQQIAPGQIDNNRPIEEMPYQSGEFITLKSELNEMWPAMWRVDGKTLLQKFEPFEENGKVLYRNISTYTVWNPDNKKLYTQVPVKIRSQSHLETIIELVRNELPLDDCNFIEKRMLETQMYQENFEVYIQTLISHALDPNFLMEIFQEQDEYFLSNVKTVDEVTETMRSRVSSGVLGNGGGARSIDAAVGTWPGLSVTAGNGTCRACSRPAVARLLLYGQPYNPGTLEPVQPDARLAYEKEFLVCTTCCGRVQLYSRISHQKYLMYAECSKRVAEKRMQNPSKDTTVILNELLADEVWLSQLFRDVRHSWAEAESWERKMRHAMSRQMI